MNPAIPYDPASAFAPTSLITCVPFVLTLHPSVPARSLDEFLAHLRANSGQRFYASIGPGTVTHLAMEELKARLGLEIVHVPYRGFPPATLDLLAGQVQATFNVTSAALQHMREGGLVAIAQTGESRFVLLPDVPTLEEAGLLDTSFFGWTGIVASAGSPPKQRSGWPQSRATRWNATRRRVVGSTWRAARSSARRRPRSRDCRRGRRRAGRR